MNKNKRIPDTLKTLDPRVFSEYSLVFYDPTTLDVAQVIKNIPKGVDLERMQRGMEVGKFSVGLTRGKVPAASRRKYVDGEIIPLSDPNLLVSMNTPFAIRGEDGYLTPLILINEEYKVTIRSVVENGRIYRYIVDHPLRVNASKGMLNRNSCLTFKGKETIKFKSVGISSGDIVHIKVRSPFLRETLLEVYCADNTF